MSLEGLSLYHNCLRSLPPAIANLQALTHLNVRYSGKGGSRGQLEQRARVRAGSQVQRPP